MTQIKNAVLFFTFILLFSACTERIEIDLNTGENNRLVVEGGITNETKIHTIKLTRSSNYFYNEVQPIELEANVSISDDVNTFVLNDTDNDGIYETQANVTGIPGKEYTLNIELKDGSQYSATAYMNFVEEMDSIRYEYVEEFDFEQNDFSIPVLKIH